MTEKKRKLINALWFIALIIFFGYISKSYAGIDLGDANATQDELTQFNEKYLKNKIQPDTKAQAEIANTVKISDIAKMKDINETMKNIEQSSFGQNLKSEQKSEQAKKIEELTKSSDFRNTVKENKKYILENYDIGGKKMTETKETKAFKEETAKSETREKLFIVISSSMPDAQVREYFKQVEGKEGVTFVLRGLVGEPTKFGPTKEYLEKIVKKHPSDKESQEVYNVAVEINPKVTRKYGIEKVPAFIYVSDYSGQLEVSEPINKDIQENFWVAYGMASIEYIVEQINKEAKSKWLSTLLTKDTFFNNKSEKK